MADSLDSLLKSADAIAGRFIAVGTAQALIRQAYELGLKQMLPDDLEGRRVMRIMPQTNDSWRIIVSRAERAKLADELHGVMSARKLLGISPGGRHDMLGKLLDLIRESEKNETVTVTKLDPCAKFTGTKLVPGYCVHCGFSPTAHGERGSDR